MNVLWRIIDVLLPQRAGDGPDYRKRVEWLLLMRLVVTTFLLAATIFFQLQEAGSAFVEAAVPLYVLVGTTFLLSLIYALGLPVIPNLWAFSFVQVMIDVLYSTVLIYFTGGASSVFTLLYVFPIASSGILHLRRGAMITAATCAIVFGVMMNLLYHGVIPSSEWPWVSPWGSYTPGYVVWVLVVHVTIFVFVAILSSSVSEQLQRTTVSLSRREFDYRKLSELHTNIVRSIPSGIITTDAEDRITFVNTAGTGLLGLPLSEMIGLPLQSVFPVIDDLLASSNGGQDSYRTVKDLGGRQMHVELTVSHLMGEDGNVTGRMVVFQDVTNIRKMEERVRQSEKQAAFVRIAAGMAHEIRNPLAAIRGASELLSRSAGLVDHDRLMGIVIRESDRLNALLSDFLVTVSGRPNTSKRMLLSALAEQTVEQFSADPKCRQDIYLESLINQGVEVEGEPAQLRQAFWSLISNAAEATPTGGVIRVVLESDQQSGQAVFKVQDWGSGIPVEIKDRLFEPFITSKERGTGLGLALVWSVVEAHQGTVEFDSTPGLGSLFVIRLPLAHPETNKTETEQNYA